MAPLIVIRAVDDFYSTEYGQLVRLREPRDRATAAVLDVFIRGGPIPVGSTGIVELEQGETHQGPTGDDGRLRQIQADDVAYRWFRFRLPSLDP